MATSAAFRSPSVAIWAAVFINSFNYIFSGVPYSQNQVTWILRWLRFLSPSFYADQLLVFNQFHGREYPNSLITGNAILEQNGWLKVPPSISICGMILLGIFYNIMGQSLLVLTSRPRKE
jgi:ABC-type multidrug transport system permease subunit